MPFFFFFPLQSSFTQGQIYRRNMSLKLIGRVFSKSSDIRSNKRTLLSLLVSFYQVRYRDEGLKDSICDKKKMCVNTRDGRGLEDQGRSMQNLVVSYSAWHKPTRQLLWASRQARTSTSVCHGTQRREDSELCRRWQPRTHMQSKTDICSAICVTCLVYRGICKL